MESAFLIIVITVTPETMLLITIVTNVEMTILNLWQTTISLKLLMRHQIIRNHR